VVQLPSPDHFEEIVLTPPLAPEAALKFSKRNASRMEDKMEDRAVKLAYKKDLGGNPMPACKNSFEVLSNYELISRANKMGVDIPDDKFTSVDVIRELEHVRCELDNKSKTESLTQGVDEDIVVVDGLGKSNPVDLEWLDQEEHVFEQISSSKSKKKKQRKVSIKTPRPVIRSQKNTILETYPICNPTSPPGRVTRSKFHKKRSK
jgi:hypothetical protein